MSHMAMLTYRNETLPRRAWAARLGITESALKKRLRQGAVAQALATGNQRPHHVQIPATARRVTPMLYCPVHEVAWCRGLEGEHWHTVPQGMLALALTYARVFGCAGQITVTVVPCQHCVEEEGKADAP